MEPRPHGQAGCRAGGRASSSRRCSALTGKSASCSRPRRPSARHAGPTSPSPCARARPCLCGRPRPHPSTTSPSSLRTSRPARRRPAPTMARPARRHPAPTTAHPACAHRPPGFGSALPPPPAEKLPGPAGQSARPRGGDADSRQRALILALCSFFGRSGARGRPAPAPPRAARRPESCCVLLKVPF